MDARAMLSVLAWLDSNCSAVALHCMEPTITIVRLDVTLDFAF